MSAVDRFDQRFTGLLEDLGAASYPDYFDDALEVAMHRTQRPTWTFPERWLPMGVLAQRPALVPSVPWRTIGIVALLALLGVALAIAIGSQRRVPPPFGPAANGVVAAMRDGDIYVHDIAAGTQRLIVGGDELDVYPIFSRDGARLAFLRFGDEAAVEGTLFVVAPDGSGARALFGPEPFQAAAWSPSSDRLAVITGETERSLWIVPADGSDPTGPLDLGGVTPYSDVLWRPPDGRELVFKGVLNDLYSIYSVPVDGSAPPRRLAHQGTERGFAGAYSASPDGTQLTYTEVGDSVWSYVVDLGAGNTRRLGADLPALPNTESSSRQHSGGAMFSPDGKQIVFGRYWNEHDGEINHQLWVTGADGDGEDAIPVGPVHRSRSGHDPFWYTFAPDGKNVLILGNEVEEAWLAPVDRSDPQPLETDWGLLGDPPEWQRLAP